MGYSSDAMKKYYKSHCDEQRAKNLKLLREEITGLSQAKFQNEIGFTKSDLSCLESGDKLLSLFHIQAYKCYFKEHYNLDVSVDYLMGYTSIITNDNMKTEQQYGLSDSSIASLKLLTKMSKHIWKTLEKGANFETRQAMPDYMEVVNFLLSRDIEVLQTFLNNIYYQMHIDDFGKIKAVSDDMEFEVDKAYLARATGETDEIIDFDKTIVKYALQNALNDLLDKMIKANKEAYSLNPADKNIFITRKD